MRPLAISALLIAAFSLTACGETGGFPLFKRQSHGIDPKGEGVDGLTVGHRLMAADEPELALKAYLRAAGEQGINADTLSAIGSANLALGRLGQAEQSLRRALEHDPAFVPALNNLGVVLMERGQVGEARAVFQRAFAEDSGASDAIRDNLKRAIALSEAKPEAVAEAESKKGDFQLVRRDKGQYVLLTQL